MKKIIIVLALLSIVILSGCSSEEKCYEDYKDNELFDNVLCNTEPTKCKYTCEELKLEYFTWDGAFGGTDCFCLNEGLPIQVY